MEKNMENINLHSGLAGKTKRVLVAMSGGVDSAYAAFSLKKSGFEVVGVHFKMGDFDKPESGPPRCCSIEDARDARTVAGILGIPFYVVSLVDVFEKQIIIPFVKAYAEGLTPNPCIRCNPLIKWKYLFKKAEELGMDAVATGHHARIERDKDSGRVKLFAGPDEKKDQSYFLSRLSVDQLEKTILPAGGILKSKIREDLNEAGIPVADKAESQDICFVGDGGHMEVVERYLKNEIPPPGNITDLDGNVLGKHKGIHHYTIGQRKGLSISAPQPLYVTEVRVQTNEVIVGKWEDCGNDDAFINNVHWTNDAPSPDEEVQVKIRYRSRKAPCKIIFKKDGVGRIIFNKPQRSVTPGQTAVFYRGDEVLGSGTFIREIPHEQ
jgi:tRNA-uridine 2-sulfurtransferase